MGASKSSHGPGITPPLIFPGLYPAFDPDFLDNRKLWLFGIWITLVAF